MAESWSPPPLGSPCWVEIPASDVQACKNFYSSLFPSWEWRSTSDALKYPADKIAMYSFAGKSGLTGGIVYVPATSKEPGQSQGCGITIYHFVESIDETAKQAISLGGTAAGEKTVEGDHGFYMYFKDVAGNRFGLYELKKA